MINQLTSGLYMALLVVSLFVVPCALHALWIMVGKGGNYRNARIIPVGITLVWSSSGIVAVHRVALDVGVFGWVEPVLLLVMLAGGLCLVHGLGWFFAERYSTLIAAVVALAAFFAGLLL